MTQTFVLTGAYRRSQAHKCIDAAPEGHVAKISAPRRSNEQNDKMWAMLSDVSRAKPEGRNYPPEIWKALAMDMAGHKPRFEPSLDGNGVVCCGYRSSRLTVAEMSDVIEAIAAYAAEQGIRLTQTEG